MKVISIRVTESELAQIQASASAAGQTVEEYVLARIREIIKDAA